MSRLTAFVRLDFITVKPYLKTFNLLIFGVIGLYLSYMLGGVAAGLSIGTMLGLLLVSYTFVIGEKHNMDALYVTLAVGKNTVVAGRYLFSLLLNLCLIAASCALAIIVQAVTKLLDIASNSGSGAVGVYFVMAAMLLIVQAIQLPIFFRIGYTRAKFVSIFPFCVIFGGTFALSTLAGETLETITGTNVILAICAVLVMVVFISYRLSVSFYRKREF